MSARRRPEVPAPSKAPVLAITGIVAIAVALGAWWFLTQGPDSERIARAIEAAESELAQESPERESLLAVLGELRRVAADEGDREDLSKCKCRE